MTAKLLLTTLLPLVADLSRELPESERYRRLLEAMRALLPCDAAALLRLDGEWLVPLAVDGLSLDTLAALCDILDVGVEDLIEVTVVNEQTAKIVNETVRQDTPPAVRRSTVRRPEGL